MNGDSPMMFSEAQQRTYVDAIFAMAALDGYIIIGTTGKESGDRPVVCAKRVGRHTVEIGWSDEADHGPNATRAVWEVEVNERYTAGGWKVHLVHPALHAPDALRVANGLVRLYHALTQRSLTDTSADAATTTPRTAGRHLR